MSYGHTTWPVFELQIHRGDFVIGGMRAEWTTRLFTRRTRSTAGLGFRPSVSHRFAAMDFATPARPSLKQRAGKQDHHAAHQGVVDGGPREISADKFAGIRRHAATGLALAMRSRIPDAQTPDASMRSIHAGNP